MNYTIDMEHWQRKTIYLGRKVSCVHLQCPTTSLLLTPRGRSASSDCAKVYEDSSDASIWQQLYIADLFYDGKNAARKAKLRIRMKQFADHFTAERPGSIFDVFASIGAALLAASVIPALKAIRAFRLNRRGSPGGNSIREPVFALTYLFYGSSRCTNCLTHPVRCCALFAMPFTTLTRSSLCRWAKRNGMV